MTKNGKILAKITLQWQGHGTGGIFFTVCVKGASPFHLKINVARQTKKVLGKNCAGPPDVDIIFDSG